MPAGGDNCADDHGGQPADGHKSISREIGILTDGCAIEGPDFRRLDPDGQREVLKTMQVPRLGGILGIELWAFRASGGRGACMCSAEGCANEGRRLRCRQCASWKYCRARWHLWLC